MKEGDICPVCSEGVLQEHIDARSDIPFYFSTCSECGSEITSYEQTLRNKELMLKYLEENR